MVEEKIGVITHYFTHINVAVIKITNGELNVGDVIHVVGAHTDFTQTVDRLEIDRNPIDSAKTGQEIGMKVQDRVREHDVVYKQ